MRNSNKHLVQPNALHAPEEMQTMGGENEGKMHFLYAHKCRLLINNRSRISGAPTNRWEGQCRT